MEGYTPKTSRINESKMMPTGEPEKISRREAMKKLGEAVAAITAIIGGGSIGYVARGTFKEGESKMLQEEPAAKEQTQPAEKKTPAQEKNEKMLEDYTFLTYEPHPREVPAGALEGQKLADLYAEYVGVPDGMVVPETLHVDFKANLVALWQKKFKFNKEGRSSEEEQKYRKQFLNDHRGLMDLAEDLCSSYDPEHTSNISLVEYIDEAKEVVKDTYPAFKKSMGDLSRDARTLSKFPEEKRMIIERMASRVDANMLLACSLTELMPSDDGEENATMMDFLLQHAGTEFVNRIPAVHDLESSFGPYQITPVLFKEGGAGSFAEAFENKLPADTMPDNIADVSGKEHHRVAYIAALEHLVQFTRNLSRWETIHIDKRLAHSSHTLLDEEVLSFVAASHHLPAPAYDYFKELLVHEPMSGGHVRTDPKEVLAHMKNKALHQYAHKALNNYVVLSTPEKLARIDEEVS